MKTDVQLKLTLKQLLLANILITAILGGLVCLVIFGYPYLMIQWVWLAIACSVFIVCVGGVIYVRMENAPDFPTQFD